MKSCLLMPFAVAALVAVTSVAQESGQGTCPASGCPAASAAVAHQEPAAEGTQTSGTCPIEAGMKLLPAIHYWVGDQEACCANSAAAMAKSKNLPVSYRVGDHSFDNEEAAFMGLIEATEQFVNKFATPKTCEASGHTMIAGESCECPVKAEERASLVRAAMEKVALTYKVGDEKCGCPVTAKEMAEKAHQPVVFVLGEEEIPCEHMARLKLAQAKYRAALTALHTAAGTPATVPAQTLTSEIR